MEAQQLKGEGAINIVQSSYLLTPILHFPIEIERYVPGFRFLFHHKFVKKDVYLTMPCSLAHEAKVMTSLYQI